MKTGTIQGVDCVALGAVLGCIAATKDYGRSSKDAAATVASYQDAAKTGATHLVADEAATCSDGVSKNVLLAQAETKTTGAKTGPAAAAKKPNILVIFGDDIGTWNVGA